MKTFRTIINVILALGCFMVFNESNTFTPNFIGLACFVGLILFNAPSDTWKINEK